MGFNFFHFIGNLGDQGNDPRKKDRSGVLGFLQGGAEGLGRVSNKVSETVGGDYNPVRAVLEKNRNVIIPKPREHNLGFMDNLKQTIGETAAFTGGFAEAGVENSPIGSAARNIQRGVSQVTGNKDFALPGSGGATGSFSDAFDPNKGGSLLGGALNVGGDLLGGKELIAPAKVVAKTATKGASDFSKAIGQEGNIRLDPTADSVKNMNRTANMRGAEETRQQATGGLSEDKRLTNPRQLQQAKEYQANNLPADATPDTTVKVYRAADPNSPVKTGDFVSLTEEGAQKYAQRTPGLQVIAQDVPLGDLVHGNGLKNEYVLAPRSTPEVPTTRPAASGELSGPTEPQAPTPRSALEELDQKMVSGIPTKEENAINLSDIPTPENKGKLASAAESVYSKLTKGDDLSARLLKIRQATTNRYAPIDEMTKKYEELTGTTLAPENDPGVRAALAAGAPDKVRARIDQLHQAVLGSGADPQAVKQLGVLRQMATDRSGVKNPLSPQRISQAMSELEAKLGPEGFAKAEKAVQKVQGIQREMLDYAQEFLGKDVVDRIAGKNPNYFTKFDALEHLIDNQETIKVGGSFNHASQNAVQGTKGGFEGAMGDPFESMIRQWGKIISFGETNKVGQTMGKMADQLEKSAPEAGLAIKTRSAENVAERMKLYGENKLFKPVRDTLDRAAKKSEGTYRTIAREMKLIDKELGKKQKEAIVKDVKKTGDSDAIPAAKDLTRNDVREIVQQSLNWKDTQFARLENKLRGRSAKMDDLLDDIQLARDQATGITERMRGNREQAKLLGDKPVPDGYEKVSYFRNGIKEEIAVPKDVADAMKNMNSKQADFITKAASFQTRALRSGATALNVAFTAPNAVRDITTAMITSENQAAHQVIQNWLRGFAHAWKQDDLVKQFIDAGGGQSGFYGRGGNIANAGKRIGETTAQKVGRTITSPKELLQLPFKALTKVASSAEQATRLAEFEAAGKSGLSPEAAAYAGRNVSVDFNRAGTIGRIANQWVPFLNARLQGTLNIGKAIRRDPARAAAVIGTTVVAPTVATYLWNRENFNDVYDQIPDYVKQNNFVIVYGDAKDANGNFTQVAKIPKGDAGKLFGNPLENLLDYAYNHNPETLSQIAVDTGSTLSPISFSREGKIDPGLAVGSVLPPAVRGIVENASNFSFFRGAPVVSDKLSALPANEQVGPSTSPVAKGIGAVTGQSPLKVDNFIQAIGGGLGQQIADPKKFVTAPGKSFSGAPGGEVENRFYSTLDKTAPLRASASVRINKAIQAGDMELARSIADNYNEKLRSSFSNFRENYGHLANDDLKDTYAKQKINLTRATIAQRASAIKAQKKKLERQQTGV